MPAQLLAAATCDRACGDALGGKSRCQRVERAADLIKFLHSGGVDFGHDQPAAAILFDQLLLLEQLQCMADRLPRYPERAAELLLADAPPGSERPVDRSGL